jgi:hypothetical protein
MMEVKLLHENTDGSACYGFDLTKEDQESLLKYGILEALKAAIREGEKLTCEGEDINES